MVHLKLFLKLFLIGSINDQVIILTNQQVVLMGFNGYILMKRVTTMVCLLLHQLAQTPLNTVCKESDRDKEVEKEESERERKRKKNSCETQLIEYSIHAHVQFPQMTK